MKKLLLFICLTCFPLIVGATGEISNQPPPAEEENYIPDINYNIDLSEEIQKEYKDAVSINTPYKIDLSNLERSLKILHPEKEFIFNWNLKGATSQSGVVFERTFKEKGEKELELSIVEIVQSADENGKIESQPKVLITKNFKILVFEKSFFLIYSDEIEKGDIESYIEFSKKDGIFINKVGPLNKTDIELTSILNSVEKYEKEGGLKSDFITIWGSRDFIFNILSKVSGEVQLNEDYKKRKLNIISISAYNIDILDNYLKNFLANKVWIGRLLLMNENSKYLILKQNLIADLETKLKENNYEFIDVNLKDTKVNNFFFVSKLVNNLSNQGYTTSNIYILLVIPFLLTIIIFFKHFIGLSPIGLTIPLFITLLFFKLGFVLGISVVIFYICFNLLLSVFIDRYNLLYAPKMALLININILVFMIFINIGYTLNLIVLNLSDILYFILFVIISEKMINIIISKDLLEYKEPFVYTVVIATFSYVILNINMIKIIIIAYPEILIGLIPVNFLIGKFSGLRVTEYFRFKEIIKSIEEE